ncbi:B3 DNA binding domain [Dillenia turbinata]|uniref:B3 DNA binding domain n=1 Tax=Dillenia turbinata TaxID=194707 RepID=A0AAN8YYN9_9MAGN
MPRKFEACEECTQNCLQIHAMRKSSSAVVSSFFKVMIDDDFSEVMFLPPKFGQSVSDLVNQKMHLLDTNGQKWYVTLSIVDGVLAFKKGWRDFALDHGLEIGDFVMFYYILGSHFVVHIYRRHGCQEFEFPIGNRKRRKRAETDSTTDDDLSETIATGSTNGQSITPVVTGSDLEISTNQCDANDVEEVPMTVATTCCVEHNGKRIQTSSDANFSEEPFNILNRGKDNTKGEKRRQNNSSRRHTREQGDFKLPNGKSNVDQDEQMLDATENDGSFDHADLSRSKADQLNKCPASKMAASESVQCDAISTGMTSQKGNGNFSSNSLAGAALYSERSKDSNLHTASKEPDNFQCPREWSNRYSNGNQNVISGKEHGPLMGSTQDICEKNEAPRFSKFPVPIGLQGLQPGNFTADIELKRRWSSTLEDQVCKVVKTEPVDSISLAVADAVRFSCPVVSQTYLELPESLQLLRNRGRQRVVLLQDACMRLWPVFYQERAGIKALTSGWDAFCKKNNIKPNDHCVFEGGKSSDGIFNVSVIKS